jgi:hypothetical protein
VVVRQRAAVCGSAAVCSNAAVWQSVRQCGNVLQCRGQCVVVHVAACVCLSLIIRLFVFCCIRLNLS